MALPEQVDWNGGQLEVSRQPTGGWGIEHRVKDGKVFGIGWQKSKVQAIREASAIAKMRGCKLFVEQEAR